MGVLIIGIILFLLGIFLYVSNSDSASLVIVSVGFLMMFLAVMGHISRVEDATRYIAKTQMYQKIVDDMDEYAETPDEYFELLRDVQEWNDTILKNRRYSQSWLISWEYTPGLWDSVPLVEIKIN